MAYISPAQKDRCLALCDEAIREVYAMLRPPVRALLEDRAEEKPLAEQDADSLLRAVAGLAFYRFALWQHAAPAPGASADRIQLGPVALSGGMSMRGADVQKAALLKDEYLAGAAHLLHCGTLPIFRQMKPEAGWPM